MIPLETKDGGAMVMYGGSEGHGSLDLAGDRLEGRLLGFPRTLGWVDGGWLTVDEGGGEQDGRAASLSVVLGTSGEMGRRLAYQIGVSCDALRRLDES